MKNFLSKAFCFVMALATLNSSMDVPDSFLYKHISKSKMFTVNEVESIVEFLTEFVLDSDIKFNEQRDDDNDSNQLLKKFSSLKFYQRRIDFSLIGSSTYFQKQIAFHDSQILSGCIRAITPPPPQAA